MRYAARIAKLLRSAAAAKQRHFALEGVWPHMVDKIKICVWRAYVPTTVGSRTVG